MNILENAADRLENHWCRESLRDGDKFCAVGILADEMGFDWSNTEELELGTEGAPYEMVNNSVEGKALADEIMLTDWYIGMSDSGRSFFNGYYEKGEYSVMIYCYNDEQVTKEPVMEVMKHAAKRLNT